MRPLLAAMLVLQAACSAPDESSSVTSQEERVARAEAELAIEKARIKTMQDSLATRTSQNIDLGMSPEKAETTEKALIEVQRTVVNAAEVNLKHQKELQALMKSGQR